MRQRGLENLVLVQRTEVYFGISLEVTIDLVDVLLADLGVDGIFPGERTRHTLLWTVQIVLLQSQTYIQIQIRLFTRRHVRLILVLAELAHLLLASADHVAVCRVSPQLHRNIEWHSWLAVTFQVVYFAGNVAFLSVLVQLRKRCLHGALYRLLLENHHLICIHVAQELIWLFPIDVYLVVNRMRPVSALVLVDVFGERVLCWRSPLILITGFHCNVVGSDDFHGAASRRLGMGLETSSTHLFAAVHALFDHREGRLIDAALHLPRIVCFRTLALVLDVYLRADRILIIRVLNIGIVARLHLITAEIPIEQLILVAHPVILVESFHVTPISHPEEVVPLVVFIMAVDVGSTEASAQSLANTHVLEPFVPCV